MKIYDTDQEVYGRTTKISAVRTRNEIDGVLARFGVKKYAWTWDPDNNDVFVMFELPAEKFKDSTLSNLQVKLEPPRIWHKGSKADTINWKASMRNLYWYILTHLSQAYVMQSGKVTEFLPHIMTKQGKFINVIMSDLKQLPKTVMVEP